MKPYITPDVSLLFPAGDLLTGSPVSIIYDEIPGNGDESPFLPL